MTVDESIRAAVRELAEGAPEAPPFPDPEAVPSWGPAGRRRPWWIWVASPAAAAVVVALVAVGLMSGILGFGAATSGDAEPAAVEPTFPAAETVPAPGTTAPGLTLAPSVTTTEVAAEVDCDAVSIVPASPEGMAVVEELVATEADLIAAGIVPSEVVVSQIVAGDDWVILTAGFTRQLEAALFVGEPTDGGRVYAAVWSGTALSEDEIREVVRASYPAVPDSLMLCLDLSGFVE